MNTTLHPAGAASGEVLAVTFERIEAMAVELADQINHHMVESGKEYDFALIVQRGGTIPGTLVAARLGFIGCEMLSIGMSSYEPGTTTRVNRLPRVGQMPDPHRVKGKHILALDEVWESGHSMRYVKDELEDNGVASIDIGVLHFKPNQNEVDIVPDFYVEKTDQWVDYFWEQHQRVGKVARAARLASRTSEVCP